MKVKQNQNCRLKTFVNPIEFRKCFLLKKIVKTFLGSPHARRAFFIAFTGIVLSFLTGIIILMGYVTDIFYRSGSSLSEKNSSILVSITQIIANLVLLNIVERVNRKVCIFSQLNFAEFSTIFISMNEPLIQSSIHRHFISDHRC